MQDAMPGNAPSGEGGQSLILDARHASLWRGGTRRARPMWRPPGAILCCYHTPGCVALRAPHPGLCMVRPSGPNLANLPFYCRKAAEALTALKCQLDKGLH